MSNKAKRASKGKAPAPRIALCLGIVGVLYVIYVIGATFYATRKYETDQGAKGSYGAAIADREASYAPMTDQQKNRFIREVKDGRVNAANAALEDWMQARHAKAFNKQLKGTWRSIPQGQEPSREFRAVLYKSQFMLESERKSEETAARLGISGKQLWSDSTYKIRAVPTDETLEITQSYTHVTLNMLPCRKIVTGHTFDDCITRMADGRLIEVAYRDRDLTEDEAASLKAGVARTLQILERGDEDRAFDP